MTRNFRDELATLLSDCRSGSFSTGRSAPVDDLALEVSGVGLLRLPVPAAQAKTLRLFAHPAKYGHGEQTILDRRVRDTWEVPRSRVKIDKRRWNRTLGPMLDAIRDDLGLPVTCSLKAELHSMLVYEPQQFFAAHQDSEKSDRMIATMVVMLPSNSTGGELVLEHRGESVQYRGSPSSLTFVAFYADTRHEVLAVERGHRVVLTYNLVLSGDTSASQESGAIVAAAADLLEGHFTHTPQPRWSGDPGALEPPDRLVFLLDHQYTNRGLDWSHLKGDDATRASVLRSAAKEARCQAALAHAEIHETWDALERVPHHWGRWDDDPHEVDDTDLELGELIDSESLIVPAAGGTVRFDPDVTFAELAAATPSAELAPYDTEYTGYMGNWGNTMDRWYRRAAIVIWPRARSFAVAAKGDPSAALHELLETGADGPAAERTRAERVATLLRFWPDGVRRGDQTTLLSPTLRLARELDDESATDGLLEPFTIEAVAPTDASLLVALTEQHGDEWFDRQLVSWIERRPPGAPTRAAWVESLPDLCTGLHDVQDSPEGLGTAMARTLMTRLWGWMEAENSRAASVASPSRREATLQDLAAPLLAFLQSTSVADEPRLRQAIIDTVCDPAARLTPLLVGVVESSSTLSRDELDQIGVGPIGRHCVRTLQAELAQPERSAGDWSITEFDPGDCCDDCSHLAAFLVDPAQQVLTWPLAKPRRQHIHMRIDETELPVAHHTKRQGSPHKLILTKTAELFTRDAARRTAAQSTVDFLSRLVNPAG